MAKDSCCRIAQVAMNALNAKRQFNQLSCFWDLFTNVIKALGLTSG
jgi:hypothetical protein